MSNIFDALKKETENSVVCLGLDTRPEYLPQAIMDDPELSLGDKIYRFNKDIIDATKDLVACYKVQIACYEALGLEGLKAYSKTLKAIRDAGKIAIGDVKRGDIFSTAEEYAKGHFTGDFETDIITVNPYMGYDAILPYKPYFKDNKGLFVLLHTSNPSSEELEELELSTGEAFYERVAERIEAWGKDTEEDSGYQAIGAVVGLTYPKALLELSKKHPKLFFLVPGYGAQGGSAAELGELLSEGVPMVVNNSRGLITAHKGKSEGEDYIEYIKNETAKMRKDLKDAQKNSRSQTSD